MRIHPVLLSAMFAVTLAVADSARAARSLEDAVEAQSSDLLLPATVPGTLSAKSCSSCPLRTLQLTSSSQYFNGNHAIAFGELRRLLGSGRYPVLLALKPDSSVVTRVVITGGAYAK